jgi:hypothetical protein
MQLVGAAWRLLGQLAAAEQLLFALLRPAWLQRLHGKLAGALAAPGCGLQGRVLLRDRLTPGACPTQLHAWLASYHAHAVLH